VHYEVLDTESDLDGVIDILVIHDTPAGTPCSWSDCCRYDLTVRYGAHSWVDSQGVRTFDLDGDHDVDMDDVNIFVPWLMTGTEFCGDFNGDGMVSMLDQYDILAHAMQGCACGATGVAGSDETDETDAILPLALEVRPNPVAAGSEVHFHYSQPGVAASLEVYDLTGRRVRSLESGGGSGAGRHLVTWDGRDDRGRAVGSGVYFCRLRSGGEGRTARFVLLR
jgi:hypothetical protein